MVWLKNRMQLYCAQLSTNAVGVQWNSIPTGHLRQVAKPQKNSPESPLEINKPDKLQYTNLLKQSFSCTPIDLISKILPALLV